MDRDHCLNRITSRGQNGPKFCRVKRKRAGIDIHENSPSPGQCNCLDGRGKCKWGGHAPLSLTYPLPPQCRMNRVRARPDGNTMLYTVKPGKVLFKLCDRLAENKLRGTDDFGHGIVDFLF